MKKCAICNQILKDEDMESAIKIKSRYTHSYCFNNRLKVQNQKSKEIIKTRPKIELKQGLSEEEYAFKKKYYDKIKELLGVENINAKIYKLSEDYIKQYNFNFKGLLETIIFFYEIKQNAVIGDLVGIIPYTYDEAVEYFKQNNKIKNDNLLCKFTNDSKIVYVENYIPIKNNIDISKL